MNSIYKIFLRGLFAILPILLTVYLLIWSFTVLESILSGILYYILPEGSYVPGLGLAMLILSVFLVGLALSQMHLESTFLYLERRFSRLPVIRIIYGTCKDFLSYFNNQNERKKFNQVVTVKLPQWDCKMLGFITEEDLNRHNDELAEDHWIAVYFPMGYQIGGYTLLMDKKYIEPVNMPIEDAMRFVLTAGVAASPSRPNNTA